MRLAIVPGIALAVCLLHAPASAQPQDRLAQTHFEAGRSYYDQGRYEDALREFEEAHRLASDERKPVLLFNIGQVQERLGRLPEAIYSFRQYLEKDPRARDRVAVEERVRNLQARLDATGILVRATEDGARVFVDDTESGTTPLSGPIQVTPGTHEIRVQKPGFRDFLVRVSVPAGEQLATEAVLVADPEAASTGPGRTGPEGPVGPRSGASGGRTLTWVAAGVAGAAVVGGTVLGILALGKRDEANDAAVGDRATYDDAKSSAESLALLADVAFGLAVVAAGVAVVLYFSEGEGDSEERVGDADGPLPVGFVGTDHACLGLAGRF